jgi:hypothetical protein
VIRVLGAPGAPGVAPVPDPERDERAMVDVGVVAEGRVVGGGPASGELVGEAERRPCAERTPETGREPQGGVAPSLGGAEGDETVGASGMREIVDGAGDRQPRPQRGAEGDLGGRRERAAPPKSVRARDGESSTSASFAAE